MLGNFLTFIGIMVTIWLAWVSHLHKQIENSDEARRSYLDDFQSPGFRPKYEKLLGGGLTWLEKWFGGGYLNLKTLGACLTLALVYSIGFFLINWWITGTGTIGRTTVMPGDLHGAWRTVSRPDLPPLPRPHSPSWPPGI